jgi:small subunit ribosomal protein S6
MKIIPKEVINNYELTFLVLPTLIDNELEKIKKELTDLITKHKGKVSDYQSWGKKRLAYFLKRNGVSLKEANYQHIVFEMNTKEINDLKKDIEFNKDVIRSLIVVKDKEKKSKKIVNSLPIKK